MKNKDFTDRVLVIGAVWFSLLAGGLTVILCGDLLQTIRNWRDWVLWSEMSQWLHIPLILLLIAFLIILTAALWRRILVHRRVLAAASTTQFSAAASRKKYAFWSLGHPLTRQKSAFGSLRPRKKIKR